MRKFATAILAGVAMSFALASVAEAKGKVIGVSDLPAHPWRT